MPSNHLILCHLFLLLPSIFPSIRVFSSESALRIRWLKYWSFSISLSKEYSGLISFRMDWCDLPAVQGTLIFHTVEHLPSQPCQSHCKSPSSLALNKPQVLVILLRKSSSFTPHSVPCLCATVQTFSSSGADYQSPSSQLFYLVSICGRTEQREHV